MNELEGLSVIYSLFNQVINKEYKLNAEYFRMYVRQRDFLKNNSLCQRLLEILDDYEWENLTDESCSLALIKDGKSPDEIASILDKIRNARAFNEIDLKQYKDYFKDCCVTGYVNKYRYLEDSPSEYMKAMQEFMYLGDHSDKLWYKVFSELDFKALDEELTADGVKSTFDFINDSFPIGMYPFGQIVMVCAAPSTGKSLFLQQEAVTMCQQGVNVHYIALGDLTEARIANRMVSLALNIPLSEVARNLSYYAEKVAPMFRDHLRITVVPSAEIHIDEYVEFALGYLKDCQVLMIDYDSNFAADTDQMYSQGRSVYDKLTKITQKGKLVFIASQPKQAMYRWEHLPMDAPAESGGKMQVVDMQIHIGRNPDSKVRMGYFDVPKNRNGEPNASEPWISCNDGSFFIVEPMLYTKYSKETDRRIQFSRNDLQLEMDMLEVDKYDNMTSTIKVK